MTTPRLFALVSKSALVTPSQLYPIALACEEGARHCADAWEVPPPAVEVFGTPHRIPDYAFPIVFVDDPNDRGWLGVHYSNRTATVFADAGSGLFNGRESISETTSHEVNESLINPDLDLWDVHPKRGALVAREVCDPVQGTHYTARVAGADLPVSNFVLPAWFRAGAKGPYDWARELTRPGQIGVGGYQILQARGITWNDFGAAPAMRGFRVGGRVERIMGP